MDFDNWKTDYTAMIFAKVSQKAIIFIVLSIINQRLANSCRSQKYLEQIRDGCYFYWNKPFSYHWSCHMQGCLRHKRMEILQETDPDSDK